MRNFYFSLLIVCLFSGLLLAWQFQVHKRADGAGDGPGLVEIITTLENDTKTLEDKIVKLRSDLDNVRKDQVSGRRQLEELQKQIETLKNIAGLTAVTGPGIIVTMDDNAAGAQVAKSSSPATFRPDDYIIHDKNVLYMVNELKAAGAEAISVNGQRIVTGSHIRCVGTVILVNSTRIAPPYEIQAIGDPDRLAAAVEHSEEFIYLKSRDFPVRVTKAKNLVLPAYSGSIPTEYLRPASKGGGDNA
ncbi:MAG: hypothetical protein PWP65_1149 [Clostridia bacterium]|nr:hypothetical protein [Clostridia bacterium]